MKDSELKAERLCDFRTSEANVCKLPMKRRGAFSDNTEPQPTPATTRQVRQLPRTSLACRHNGTGRKRARQPSEVRREKDIASGCSTIRCARDDDAPGFHCGLSRSNGDGW